MKIQPNKILSGLIVCSVIFLNSCKKEETQNIVDSETSFNQVTDNQLMLNNTVLKLQNELPALLNGNNGAHKSEQDFIGNLDCAIITRDTVSLPHTAYFDFGPNGCYGSDKTHYTGSITLQYNAEDLSQPGNSWTYTFRNFVQDTMNLNGSMTITNTGNNGSGNPTSSVSFNFVTNFGKDGLSFNGSSSFNIESINSGGTKSLLYTGGGSATRSGVLYTQNITSPLKVLIDPACGHYVSGTVLLHNATSPDKTVNYGSGICDSKATITVNGVSRVVILN